MFGAAAFISSDARYSNQGGKNLRSTHPDENDVCSTDLVVLHTEWSLMLWGRPTRASLVSCLTHSKGYLSGEFGGQLTALIYNESLIDCFVKMGCEKAVLRKNGLNLCVTQMPAPH